jgi:vacuolar-type H+-ATPase catalytic subunit A/Vma1
MFNFFVSAAGLTVGDPVERTMKPLSVELGPGIMDNIFDGIQRPLNAIADVAKSVYVPRGVAVKSLDQDKKWPWTPSEEKWCQPGSIVSGGTVLGSVYENQLLPTHKIMVPPNVSGKLKFLAPKGAFTVKDTVAIVTSVTGEDVPVRLSHFWYVVHLCYTRATAGRISLSVCVCVCVCVCVFDVFCLTSLFSRSYAPPLSHLQARAFSASVR